MKRKAYFTNKFLPYILLAPQLFVTLVFFILPSLAAFKMSFFREDAFGVSKNFVWFHNYIELLKDPSYLNALWVTLIFAVSVTVISMAGALYLAMSLNNVVKGNRTYKTLLIWPYAVAPAVAGLLMRFLFNPSVGVIADWLTSMGVHWNYYLNGPQALMLVIIAASWQQFSYNFVFFLAGLSAIPDSIYEAAALDGAGPWQRFYSIVFPLISPTTFYLFVVNIITACFGSFGIIHIVTHGGPAHWTDMLVYKVYNDGFMGLDLGGSATQSVMLMLIVSLLTIVQFYYIDRKVHY